MDALVHAIESFCARVRTDCSPHAIFVGKNPVSDILATKAITAITKFLPIAVAQPNDREAREQMALASLLAGMAFSAAGTAAVHALQYPVGEATHTPHGLGNAVLLSTVMKRITSSRIEEMAFIARSLDSHLNSQTDTEAAAKAATLIDEFASKVGIPKGLHTLGLKEAQLPELAKMATTVKRLLDNSPVSFDENDLLHLLQEAF
jgi:alcohol dehydrogenase class IV